MRATWRWVLAVAATCGCAGTLGDRSGALSAEDTVALDRACSIGRQIFLHDFANAKATDELLAAGIDARALGAEGYLEMVGSEGYRVGWIRDDEAGPKIVAQVKLGPIPFRSPIAQKLDNPEALSAEETGRWKALKIAKQQSLKLCRVPYNSVVLPASLGGENGHYVYLLANTKRSHTYVLGAHVRVHVKDLTSGAVEVSYFSSCLENQYSPEEEKRMVALGLNTPLVDHPTETHFYTSILYRMPLYLGTVNNYLLWVVDGPACAGIRRRQPASQR